jgi:hypothetical protein
MRAHGIDMWIVAVKENHREPLWEDLGRGYVSGIGYYVFTDRGGDRIERAALGPGGYLIEESGAYDIFAPASTLAAFDKALAVRDVLKRAITPGIRADETMRNMDAALRAAGYGVIEFNKPNADGRTDIVYGFHPVGNTGHDIGPSLTTWQPLQATFELYPKHIFSFEYFAYAPIPEWGGKKLRIPIEDDAILMEEGIQFLHPANYRLLVVK